MATIGNLSVKVDADTSGLSTGLTKAGKSTTDFENKIDSLSNKLKVVGPLAVAAGAAFAVSMVKSVADTADQLAKLSARTGVAVEDLSRLQYAAGLSGVSNETLTSSIERLSRGMSEASTGAGAAGQAFAAMGLNVKNQDGTLKSQSVMMSELADRFASYKDGAEKTALAQQIFGRSGAQLIPLLNGGAKGLKDMADESDRLGNTISTKTAKAAEQFNDNITRMNTAVGGVARTISGPLIEALADLTGGLFEAFMQGETLFGSFERGFKRMAQAKTIDEATQKVAALELEYAKTMKSMEHLEPWEQATAGAMGLSMRLDEARARLQELTAEQQKAAEIAADPGKSTRATAPVVDVKGKEKDDADKKAKEDELKRIKEHEMAKVQAFIESLRMREDARIEATKTEQQQEKDRYALELEQLIAARQLTGMTKAEYDLLEQEALLNHREKMADIDIAYLDAQRRRDEHAAAERLRLAEKTATQEMQLAAQKIMSMTAAAASGSKELFQINKAASIANALLAARESVTSAYRFGARIGGPKLGAAFAATAALATAAQVRQLASTSFNSGTSAAGSVGSAGGSSGALAPSETAAAQPVSRAPSAPQIVSIQLQGDVFGREAVRNLISEINEAISDGAVLRLT